MKFKYVVCTFILVVMSIGAISAADDLSMENATAGELAVDSAGEVKLVDENIDENSVESVETFDNELLESENEEPVSDDEIFVEVFDAPHYVDIDDPVAFINDDSGIYGLITVKYNGNSVYSEIVGYKGNSEITWEFYDSMSNGNYGFGLYNISVYYQKMDPVKLYDYSETVEFTYLFDFYASEDGEYTDSVEQGTDINFDMYLPEDITGKVTVRFNGREYEAKVENGEGHLSVSTDGLEIGDYDISATYAGDSKYPAQTVEDVISIYDKTTKPADKITSDDFSVNINDVVDLNNASGYVFDFMCPNGAEGKIATWINGNYKEDQFHDYYVDYNYLKANVTKITARILRINAVGDYEILVKYVPYEGDELTLASANVSVINTSKPKRVFTADEFKVSMNKSLALADDKIAFTFCVPEESEGKIAVWVNGTYNPQHDYYIDGNVIGGEVIARTLKDIGITSEGDFNILVKFIPYEGDELIINESTLKVRKVAKMSASVTPKSLYYGSKLTIKFKGPKSTDKVYVYLDGKLYKASVLKTGAISLALSTLKVGSHKVKIKFSDSVSVYSKTFSVNVKKLVKLTLKSVKVKKSAKKLTLKATLKINKKAATSKKVTFKFNGKKYTARTNKYGVAKVTVKKSVLKKLKVGKKIRYQVSYGKTVTKLTAKVKK